MTEGGWKLQTLAARTRELDSEGRGVSYQLVAFLATDRFWGRETTSQRSADLIEAALGYPEGSLFTLDSQPTNGNSAQGRDRKTAA